MNMRRIAALSAICVGVSLAAGSASAVGFVNGSFETGDMTGWTTTSPYGLNPFGTTYGAGMDGTYWHWLAGYEVNIVTSQTLTGLTPGTTYDVVFIMASEYVNSDSLRISVDGGPGTIYSAPPDTVGGPGNGFWNNWVQQEYDFTATGTTATVQFDTLGLNAGGYDVGLDNVRLFTDSVPEPATWAMMLVGLGGLGAVMRTRRRADRNVAALSA